MIVRYFDETEKTYKVVIARCVYPAGDLFIIERTPKDLILINRINFIEARWL